MNKPRFWLQDGQWHCAVPRKSPFNFHSPDWWKRYGLIGRGSTKEEALKDLEAWQRAAKFVDAIY